MIRTVLASVRAASAISRPVRALALFTGNTQNRVSRPHSRSCGMMRAAAIAPNIAPATAHIGTNP
ncbi:Uncharacterised protein [Mycobacterium tuberculosis]|nr:Uncharacterised protein [Mycobacterium tuberculosis]